jgi:dihydrofolate reductase
MGHLIVTEFLTLDGVGQAPGQPDEDTDGGFAHGGWQWPVSDERSGDQMFEDAKTMDALLLGRRTYEIFAGFWPTAPAEVPFTELLNRIPKYVASRTLRGPLEWNGSTVLEGDLAAAVTAVKERHAEVHLIGSLDLAQSLLQHGLVDRLDLWVYPLLLGDGKKLFAAGTVPAALRLVDSDVSEGGPVHLVYDATGAAPTYGTMAG